MFTFSLVGSFQSPAQQSVSFRVEQGVFNAAGHPQDGSTLGSLNIHLTLDALGNDVHGQGLSSGSFHMDGGFAAAYPPPSEVADLRIAADRTTLRWLPERSVGNYALYRDPLSTLGPGPFGTCLQSGLGDESAQDPDMPGPGSGFLYLVGAANRLNEKGPLGNRSDGSARVASAPCP